MELRPGQTLGHYRIYCRLGEGGMGKVYLAEDTKLHRKVSFKFLSSNFTQDINVCADLSGKARDFPRSTIQIFLRFIRLVKTDGQRFIATEFIEGQTLRHRLRSPRRDR